MIEDYFMFLKKVATKNPSVTEFRLIREFIDVKKGFIRFVIELRDGSELHVFEYIDSDLSAQDRLLISLAEQREEVDNKMGQCASSLRN